MCVLLCDMITMMMIIIIIVSRRLTYTHTHTHKDRRKRNIISLSPLYREIIKSIVFFTLF